MQLNYQDRIKKVPAKTNSTPLLRESPLFYFLRSKDGRFKPAQNAENLRAICAPQAAEAESIL